MEEKNVNDPMQDAHKYEEEEALLNPMPSHSHKSSHEVSNQREYKSGGSLNCAVSDMEKCRAD